ncbi:protein PHYTOCHROME KINASE SUBSTRATE 3-like [Dorcoceras hygrometricum]|uniref:Protein PHYTOCHROME KINASE SUBSTRATE 3-like n=1 Tax=Dorcoceras hygrometricum TaxID=472368 RepID=A0A2Z7AR23_9LAMI|nr:protein PHYTOCHROME KINASE SUBSTRATE 3-like [Dorcoceras hygrometricum]
MENADDSTDLRVASFAYYLDSAKDNCKKSKSNSKLPLNDDSFSSSRDIQDSLTNRRVDSLSYRNTSENLVFKVPGPVQDPTASFSFCQEIPEDRKINVFDADKYFNMKPEHRAGVPKHGSKNKDIPFLAPNSRLGTQSLSSEESSRNSHAALFPGHGSRPNQKKTFGQRILGGFSCPGPCFHRKDVCINEIVADGTAYYGSKPTRVDTLAFIPPPDLVTVDTLAVMKQLQILEESRNSIEVFGSGSAAKWKRDVATNMERKLSMLTWDAIPKGSQSHRSSTIGHSTFCDDMASDASSDLFEIENISGSMYLPFTTTDQATDDQVSSCMSPISHYPPSEASIQWSVVTASAADFSSVLSFNDETSEDALGKNIAGGASSKTRGGEAKEGPKTRPGVGGILRCKNLRAVEVDENACLQVPNQDFHSRRERFYKELHV